MFITQFLNNECIIADMEASSKDEVLEILARHASSLLSKDDLAKPQVNATEVLNVLKEREQLGSTGIGGGVAIPHGKIKGIERLFVLFARSLKGVPFDALDQKAVYAIFLLLAPEATSTAYLKILARISRLLKDKAVYNALLKAKDAKELMEVIKNADKALPLSI